MKKILMMLFTVVLAVGVLVPAAVLAQDCPGESTGLNVCPRHFEDNPTPAEVGYDDCEECGCFSWKFDQTDPATFSGTYDNGTYYVEWTISEDGRYLSFANANPGLTAVIVKGGNNAYVYDYDPIATSDSGLVSPESNGIPAISHMIFIWCDNGGTPHNGNGDGEVGGEVYPMNKATTLIPVIALAAVIAAGAGIVIWRRQVQR